MDDQHDVANSLAAQLEDLGQAQRAAKRLGSRVQGFGVLAGGALGLEQPCVLDRRRGLGGECRHELREILVVEIRLVLVERDDARDAITE